MIGQTISEPGFTTTRLRIVELYDLEVMYE